MLPQLGGGGRADCSGDLASGTAAVAAPWRAATGWRRAGQLHGRLPCMPSQWPRASAPPPLSHIIFRRACFASSPTGTHGVQSAKRVEACHSTRRAQRGRPSTPGLGSAAQSAAGRTGRGHPIILIFGPPRVVSCRVVVVSIPRHFAHAPSRAPRGNWAPAADSRRQRHYRAPGPALLSRWRGRRLATCLQARARLEIGPGAQVSWHDRDACTAHSGCTPLPI